MRIHVLGASGSGTTTLAGALAERFAIEHLDVDDYYWLRSDPPFLRKRPPAERVGLLHRDLSALGDVVVSGSMLGWGDPLVHHFDLVVFLWVPQGVRMTRLAAREGIRYGERIRPGGDMHAQSQAFLEWARGYDRQGFDGRNRTRHEAWMSNLQCPVLRIHRVVEVDAQVQLVAQALDGGSSLVTHVFGPARPVETEVLRPAVYGVVRDQTKRVLVVEGPGGLFLPGGGAESGETPEETLRRELMEEVGAEGQLERHLGVAIQHFDVAGVRYRGVFDFFEVRLSQDGARALGEEIAGWRASADLPGLLRHESHAWAVRLGVRDG